MAQKLTQEQTAEKNRTIRHPKLQHWHIIAILLLAFDALSICVSWIFALYGRYDFRYQEMIEGYGQTMLYYLPVYCIGCLGIYAGMKLYNSIWRFSSFWELERIGYSLGLCTVLSILITLAIPGRLPLAVYIFAMLLQGSFTIGIRFLYRFVLLLRDAKGINPAKEEKQNALLIGAGAAGQLLLRDAKKPDSGMDIKCIVDDNPNKRGRVIDGVSVKGNRYSIPELVERYQIEVILFAIPTANPADKKDILNICQKTGCRTKMLPSILKLAGQEIKGIEDLHSIKMEDLLGRETIQVDTEEILSSLSNKVILVTGGGGSIGSELCRQIATHMPKQLIILDIYENNAYEIQNELKRKHPDLNLKVLIASVRDSRKIEEVFHIYKPQIVYHAAAHKHVPLMETSPCEAIKNNVFGTYKTAKAALENGVERFVLISTDKAVHPTNIMGATKRLCEMVIQTMNDISDGTLQAILPAIGKDYPKELKYNSSKPRTQFVAVRFGNVLGSNGSVIPLFEKQIAAGGPVTVTHPEITRFFMTIPEAVSLVLQAGTYAKGGEIFVLDMGEPVKIADLAANLIKLSGHVPGQDIKIEYTGLRPGEKLYEEKLMAEEGLEKTPNELIHIGKPIEFNKKDFLETLPYLYRTCMRNDESETILCVQHLVRTYKPDWYNFQLNGISFQDHLIPTYQDSF